MGTMVGSTPNDQIGMAPQARWIGCRNMEGGVGTPATYAECYQWFIAPTKIDGSDPNPALAPDVINNSWACPPEEGCEDPNILKSVVEAVRAAGILSVHSAGNDGPDCETVRNPATIYPASLSVGAVDDSGLIASFSSRGPVTVDGSQRLKPNVVAPGVKIRSSLPGSTYGESSGTSMAAPHVAGLAALILSARPSLKGQADVIENLILASAKPLTSGQTCGGVPGTQIPNNTYGWGRIDAWEAIRLAFPYTYYFPLVGSSR
jgi:subtilisin family serine protease